MTEKLSRGAKHFQKAQRLFSKGKIEKGIKYLQRSSSERYFQAKRYLALIELEGAGNEQRAVELANESLTTPVEKVAFEMGERYLQRDDELREKGVAWLKFAAKRGVHSAWKSVAEIYRAGDIIQKDSVEALACFIESANSGDVESMMIVATMYKRGDGCSASDTKSLDFYYKAAQEDNSKAMFYVGKAFEEGMSVDVRVDLATEWYGRSAELGYTDAMLSLARLSEARDVETAAYWYEEVSKTGNIYAFMQLGHISMKLGREESAQKWYKEASDRGSVDGGYLYAKSLNFEGEEAMQLLESASSSGVDGAQFDLGEKQVREADNDYDTECGIALIEQAAYQEFTDAELFMGKRLITSTMKAEQDRAVEYLMSAANKESIEACYELGLALLNGNGIEEDKERAGKWLRRAALGDHRRALYLVGIMHEQGCGLWRNVRDAYDSLKKAADMGEPGAIFRVGVYYEYGIEKDADIEQAVSYYSRARELGYAKGAYNMGVLHESGNGVEKSEEKAYALFQEAANGGVFEAVNNIGSYYHYGKVVDKDRDKAETYYKKAIESGVDVALYNLALLLLEDETDRSDIRAEELLKQAVDKGVEQAEPVYKELLKFKE